MKGTLKFIDQVGEKKIYHSVELDSIEFEPDMRYKYQISYTNVFGNSVNQTIRNNDDLEKYLKVLSSEGVKNVTVKYLF